MVAFNERDRPNIEEILNDHWFNEIHNLNNKEIELLNLELNNEFIKRDNN